MIRSPSTMKDIIKLHFLIKTMSSEKVGVDLKDSQDGRPTQSARTQGLARKILQTVDHINK